MTTYREETSLTHEHIMTATSSGYSATYGAAGNMDCRAPTSATTCSGSAPNGAGLGYDNAGQLVKWQNTLSGTPTSVAHFAYDGEGRRVSQSLTTGGTTVKTRYVLGLEEQTGDPAHNPITKYESVHGVCNVVIVGSGPSETISYIATDGLGSVSEALDGNGNVTAQQLYGPYGGVRYSSGTMPTAKGYTGQYADAVTGLDYYGARYYDPLVGQFTSADTASAGGLNRYAYVGGNPETRTDPTGHVYCPGTCSGGGGGGGSGCTSNCGGGGGGGTPSGGCTSDCGGGPGPGTCTAICRRDHQPPMGASASSCDGVALAGHCFSLDLAEDPTQRLNFVYAWFARFAAGWGAAEEAFMAWMQNSKRMRNSPFWQGVDGDLIFDMWTAAVEFVAGMRSTSNQIIENWLSFMADPSTAGFWQAHNTSIMAGAWSADGLTWFSEESYGEQVFINDALVNLLDGTFATTLAARVADVTNAPGWQRNIAHGCDPSTQCIGAFLYGFYPTKYPVPWTWFATPFGAADTAFACQNAVMPVLC